jgi:hypothetical protein
LDTIINGSQTTIPLSVLDRALDEAINNPLTLPAQPDDLIGQSLDFDPGILLRRLLKQLVNTLFKEQWV